MEKNKAEFLKQGAKVLVLSFTSPDRLKPFLDRYPVEFPVVADPERQVYKLFELGSTSWRTMLGPANLWKYVKLMFRGWMPTGTQPDDDLLQLGGDFILDRKMRPVYAYPSKESADRPPWQDLLVAVREAIAVKTG